MDKALDERTIGHNPERLCLMKVLACCHPEPSQPIPERCSSSA